MRKGVFLPYQIKWLEDNSRIKIWEKSRRIGATWVQAFEDVRDCLKNSVPCVWFTSADESAAKEYIRYCAHWAKTFNAAFSELGELVIDDKKGIKALVIEFKNGTRIHALSSNPTAFRSKGGKVVIDEFAFHKDDRALWAAAKPCITWGYPLRIISTHNGKGTLYYSFIEQVLTDRLKWHLHRTTIYDAVADGLVDKIFKRKTTGAERDAWLEDEKSSCGSSEIWDQEYCCVAVDETTAFLTYDMLDKIRRPLVINEFDSIKYPLYIGVDIAHKKDMTIIWGIEDTGTQLVTAIYLELAGMKFKDQEAVLYPVIELPTVCRVCMDASGLGMQMVENAQDRYGKHLVEAVTFTSSIKEVIAYQMKNAVDDGQLLIPDKEIIRADFHSVKKMVTAAGNIRFDAKRTVDGHADRFWACGLAVHAKNDVSSLPPKIRSRKKQLKTDLSGFDIGGLQGY